jgi:hypothetical protein
MRASTLLTCLALAALLAPPAGFAATSIATPAAPGASASAPPAGGEPQVIDRITEDDQVRIKELRVRGQTRRLTVQPKVKGMPAYDIAPPEPGRDPAQDPKAGKRIWWQGTF